MNGSLNSTQRNATGVVHSMLAILGIIAIKAQGFVGNEFVDTGVDPSSDGAPTTDTSAQGTVQRGV